MHIARRQHEAPGFARQRARRQRGLFIAPARRWPIGEALRAAGIATLIGLTPGAAFAGVGGAESGIVGIHVDEAIEDIRLPTDAGFTRTVFRQMEIARTGGTATFQLTDSGGTAGRITIGGVTYPADAGTALYGLGAGDPGTALAAGFAATGVDPASYTPPAVTVPDPATLGPGTRSWTYVSTLTGTTTSEFQQIINTNGWEYDVDFTGDPNDPFSWIAYGDEHIIINLTLKQINTTHELVVTVTDQAVSDTITLAQALQLFADRPDIVAALRALGIIDDLPTAGLTPNQKAVADNLNALNGAGLLAGTPLGDDLAIIAAADPAALPAILDQLHPEPYNAFTEAGIVNAHLFQDGISRRLRMERGGVTGRVALASPSSEAGPSGWTTWGNISGQAADRDRLPGHVGYSNDSFMIQGGVDRRFGEALLGISGAYHHSSLSIDSRADGSLNAGTIGLYGQWAHPVAAHGTFGLEAGLGYGWNDGSIDRRIAFATAGGAIDRTARGNFGWGAFTGRLKGFYRAEWSRIGIEPYAQLDIVSWNGFSLAETGAGPLSLNVARKAGTDVASRLGTVFDTRLALSSAVMLRPELGLAWSHRLTDTHRSLGASFSGAPAGSRPFTVTGFAPADSFDLAAGFTLGTKRGLSLTAAYDGRFGNNATSHTGSLVLNIAF